MKVGDFEVEVGVDDELRCRVTNVPPEDEITMSGLSLGNLITQILRQLAEIEEDDDDNPYEFWSPE